MAAWTVAVKRMRELDEVSAYLTSCNTNGARFEKYTMGLLEEIHQRPQVNMMSGALRRRTDELRTRVMHMQADPEKRAPLLELVEQMNARMEHVDGAAKRNELVTMHRELSSYRSMLARYESLAASIPGTPTVERIKFRAGRLAEF